MHLIPMHIFEGVEGMSQVAAGLIVSAVWQGTLLAAAVGLCLRLAPKTSAAVRFAIWFAVFVVLAGMPFVGFGPFAHSPVGKGVAGHGPLLTLDVRWSVAVAVAWALMSLGRAAMLMAGALRVRDLWRRARPVEMSRPGARGTGGTPRRAQLCVSDEVDRPSVIGFFSPRILIPAWLLGRLTEPELEQIVLHETVHLRRSDDWMNLLQKIGLVLFPLNPALLWVERRLCFERELACDDGVLRSTGAPKAYASCLTALAEHGMGRRGLSLALGALGRESKSKLERRVRSILGYGGGMSAAQARVVLGVALTVLLGGAAELSRCPQLVAFSGSGAPDATSGIASGSVQQATTGVMAGDTGVGRADIQPRVAHRLTSTAMHPQSTHVELVGYKENVTRRTNAIKPPEARHTVFPFPRVSVIDSKLENDDTPPLQRADVRVVEQWVVVTSWEGEGVSRMVLTTAARVSNDRHWRPVDLRQPSQVHPYAAVPTRDGWLVFQL